LLISDLDGSWVPLFEVLPCWGPMLGRIDCAAFAVPRDARSRKNSLCWPGLGQLKEKWKQFSWPLDRQLPTLLCFWKEWYWKNVASDFCC
jgi:hypothetical protein